MALPQVGQGELWLGSCRYPNKIKQLPFSHACLSFLTPILAETQREVRTVRSDCCPHLLFPLPLPSHSPLRSQDAFSPSLCHILPCYLRWGPQTSSRGTIKDFVSDVDRISGPSTLNQKLNSKSPRWFQYTWFIHMHTYTRYINILNNKNNKVKLYICYTLYIQKLFLFFEDFWKTYKIYQ